MLQRRLNKGEAYANYVVLVDVQIVTFLHFGTRRFSLTYLVVIQSWLQCEIGVLRTVNVCYFNCFELNLLNEIEVS